MCDINYDDEFYGFCRDQVIELAKVAGVILKAYHAYSIWST